MTDQDRQIRAIFGTSANEFKEGDRVILPPWFKLNKRQRRVNEICYINEAGGYIFMAAVLNNGTVSKDRAAGVYFPFKSATSLRHFDK